MRNTKTDLPMYAGIRRLSVLFNSLFVEENAGNTLTLDQYCVMRHLADGQERKQRELIELSGYDRSTLNSMVFRLKDCGLITVVRDIEDNRATLVKITVEGRKAFGKSAKAYGCAEDRFARTLVSRKHTTMMSGLRSTAADELLLSPA